MSIRVTTALAPALGMARTYLLQPSCTQVVRRAPFSVNANAFSALPLHDRKIHIVNPALASSLPKTLSCVQTEADWDTPSPIAINPVDPSTIPTSTEKVHYYFGGLPGLMAAARKLMETSSLNTKVVYVTDGKVPKSIQSGHQAHVHPSEWSTKDCSTFNLCKLFFEGLGLKTPAPPEDLFNYSYLHFPFTDTQDSLLDVTKLYAKCFKHRLVLDLTSRKGVSEDDQWLCSRVRESLDFHEHMSKQIEDQFGMRTFARRYRIYWSTNKDAMNKKKEMWENLGIPCEWMKRDEMMQRTLLHERANVYALKIMGDGKFFAHTPDFIMKYLRKNFPGKFCTYQAQVTNVLTDQTSGEPLAIKETLTDGQQRTKAVSTFFGSPGHDLVFLEDERTGGTKKLWREIPVSGTSTLWACTVTKKELCKRFGQKDIDDAILHTMVKEIVSSASLTNMHVTVWEAKMIEDDKVQMYVRITQGANFNSNLANKNDLYNMAENLKQFFCGHWEPISVGTCTRKTLVSNVPERLGNFGDESGFGVGYSGMGYSASAMTVANMTPPSHYWTRRKILRLFIQNKIFPNSM